MNFCSHFPYFFGPFLLNLVHKVSMTFSNYEFEGNRVSESHSLLRGVL